MAELAKRWVHDTHKTVWFLKASGCAAENRAAIVGPAKDGAYKLELWNNRPVKGWVAGWEAYMKSTDLKTLKAIGRMEAARRLHV